MNIANNMAEERSIANKEPKTIDSGMKSINIANKVPILPPFFAKKRSIK